MLRQQERSCLQQEGPVVVHNEVSLVCIGNRIFLCERSFVFSLSCDNEIKFFAPTKLVQITRSCALYRVCYMCLRAGLAITDPSRSPWKLRSRNCFFDTFHGETRYFAMRCVSRLGCSADGSRSSSEKHAQFEFCSGCLPIASIALAFVSLAYCSQLSQS